MPTRKKVFFWLVLLTVIPLGTEAGLHIVQFIRHRISPATLNYRLSLSMYKDQPWAMGLFQEERDLEMAFEQYLGWRTKAHRGEYLNIDEEGRRRTIDSADGGNSHGTSIFIFGGSSMWGAYVRDVSTIPSFMARKSRMAGFPLRVENYADVGYNFNQEVFRLMLLLRGGKRPEWVLFYDGFNDVRAVEASGRAGVIGLQTQLNDLLVSWRSGFFHQVGESVALFLERNSMIYRGIGHIATFMRGREAHPPGIPRYTESELERLSSEVSGDFSLTHAFLDSLSRIYGFRYACFLQPHLYTKSILSGEEEHVDARARDEQLRRLFSLSYAKLRTLPHRFDLSKVFDHHPETLFSDLCHVSEAGNAILADTMLVLLRDDAIGRSVKGENGDRKNPPTPGVMSR